MNLLTRFLTPKPPATLAMTASLGELYSEKAFSHVLSYLSSVPDPDLMLQKAGIQRQHLRFLELDDEVAQCVETRKDAVLNVPWRLEPNQTRASKWLAAQLEPHYDVLIRGVMSAVFYGYSVIELTYREDGGRVTIDRVDERNIEWFRLHPTLGWRFYPDDGSGGAEGLACDPRKFFFIVRHPTTRNPYGESLLSRLWFPVTWRREGWALWLQFLSTFSQPLLLAQIAGNPNDFKNGLENIGFKSVIVWNGQSTDKVTPISASQAGEFERLETALTKRIQKLILGQTLTSDVGDSGSYAAAKVHSDVMQTKVYADCRLAMTTIQSLVNTLATLNQLQPPKVILADETGLSAERAVRDAALVPVLAASGIKLTPNYFVDRYDFREDDLAVVESQEAKPEPEDAQAQAALMTMAKPRFTPTQQEIEDLVDEALQATPANPLDPALLRDAILGATDEADLRERLAVVWDGGPDAAFVDTLEKAAFMARVIGYVAAEERRS